MRTGYTKLLDVGCWPKAVIDDVEKYANSIAAFCREAELQTLIQPIAATGHERPVVTCDFQCFVPLRSVTGAMPEYFCSSAAFLNRSLCSPKATSKRGASDGPAPGSELNKS